MPVASILQVGSGNLFSTQRGFERVGFSVRRVKQPEDLGYSSCIIIPGVGNFEFYCRQLEPFRNSIFAKLEEGVHLFGICLGMQVLFQSSEEGKGNGLGIFEGRLVEFGEGVKKPHIGWNSVTIKKNAQIVQDLPSGADFYFVHSFYKPQSNQEEEVGITDHGSNFVSIVESDTIVGTQFHPERSGEAGRRLLENFVDIVRR